MTNESLAGAAVPPVAVRDYALDATVAGVIDHCVHQGINPGYALGRDYPEHENGLLVAITERRTRAHIDRLADALGEAVAAGRTREYHRVGA